MHELYVFMRHEDRHDLLNYFVWVLDQNAE